MSTAYSPFNRKDLTKKKVRIPCTMQANTRKLIYDDLNEVHFSAESHFFRVRVVITELELDPTGIARICTVKLQGQREWVRLPIGACQFETGVDMDIPPGLVPYLDATACI